MLREQTARLITQKIQALTGTRDTRAAYAQPIGDPGLLGPRSVAWRVHRQFLVMMAGGMSSLLLQSLHPQALAAVWDHSQVHQNLKGRLGRTASFIAATTYGPTDMAESVIAHVNAIHARIHGIGPDGQAYQASDPELLMWVHVAEVHAFVQAHQWLAPTPLSAPEIDTYVSEMALIAERLGVQNPPRRWVDLLQQLDSYRSDLRFDSRAATIHGLLLNFPVDWWDRPLMQALLATAQDLLPDWVWPLLGRSPAPAWRQQAHRRAIQTASLSIQWALEREGVSAVAARRMRATPKTG
jgi:uncharacterized protein (DUF2236 family)